MATSRAQYKVEEVAKALREAKGYYHVAAASLKCSRRTVHNYVQRHPSLRELVDDLLETRLDRCELSQENNIASGNQAAIQFYLDRRGRSRGYGPPPKDTGGERGTELVVRIAGPHLSNEEVLEALGRLTKYGIPIEAVPLKEADEPDADDNAG